MQVAPKPSRVDEGPSADPRYVKDYWLAYKNAWEVAWQFAPARCGKNGIDAMRAWTDGIAHMVATDFATVRGNDR